MTTETKQKFTYEIETRQQDFLSMSSLGMTKRHVGIVRRSDGVKVWTSRPYADEKTAKLQAGRSRKRYQEYYAWNGICWYDVRLEERADRQRKTLTKRAHDKIYARFGERMLAMLTGAPINVVMIDLIADEMKKADHEVHGRIVRWKAEQVHRAKD